MAIGISFHVITSSKTDIFSGKSQDKESEFFPVSSRFSPFYSLQHLVYR